MELARETGLELAVRSGGHSNAGDGVTDGGIVLDLRDMRALAIDAERRTAWAQTGLTAGDYTAAAGAYGLGTGFGDTGSVGIGGLTLGVGVGYLVRKHGLTVDNLLAAEVVTADGQLLSVDAGSHPDLFWAVRGGGRPRRPPGGRDDRRVPYARRLPLGRRLVQALGFAVLAGLAGALLAGPLLGVLPGPFVAVAGILVLLGLASALATMLLTVLLGDAGVVVATVLLVIVGNATSGGVAAASFLPGGYRQLSPLLPPGAATTALRRVDYFDAAGALGPVVVLAGWALGALLLLLLVAVRGRRRAQPVTTLAEQAGVPS